MFSDFPVSPPGHCSKSQVSHPHFSSYFSPLSLSLLLMLPHLVCEHPWVQLFFSGRPWANRGRMWRTTMMQRWLCSESRRDCLDYKVERGTIITKSPQLHQQHLEAAHHNNLEFGVELNPWKFHNPGWPPKFNRMQNVSQPNSGNIFMLIIH